jgi:hypothetical protein
MNAQKERGSGKTPEPLSFKQAYFGKLMITG